MLAGQVRDQLLNENGLADAGSSEEADLAAAHVRRDQVDDLDPGLEDLDLRRQLVERGRVAVNRPALGAGRKRLLAVDRIAEHVPDASQRHLADRDRDRCPGVDHGGTAGDAVGRVHCDSADAIVTEMLLHLCDQLAAFGARDAERRVDRGKPVREDGVDHDAFDLDQAADVLAAAVLWAAVLGQSGLLVSRLDGGGTGTSVKPPAGRRVYRSARPANGGADTCGAAS